MSVCPFCKQGHAPGCMASTLMGEDAHENGQHVWVKLAEYRRLKSLDARRSPGRSRGCAVCVEKDALVESLRSEAAEAAKLRGFIEDMRHKQAERERLGMIFDTENRADRDGDTPLVRTLRRDLNVARDETAGVKRQLDAARAENAKLRKSSALAAKAQGDAA